MTDTLKRCDWAGTDPDYIAYHDNEWGRPVHDDRHLFEMLTLEGAQAGLSWITILKRREHYRTVFYNFDVKKVSAISDAQIETILQDSRIIRNRLKVLSTISNAKAFINVQNEFGSFDHYLWGFVSNEPIINDHQSMSDVPAQTDLSISLSKDLKKRGFKFVGPTIIYAYMQAIGMVNDHVQYCHRYHSS